MRILVATTKTNGNRSGDFSFCAEGELVTMGDPCASDLRDPDGGCGCGRAFSGLSSHRATTTARVAESPLSEPDVKEEIRSSLETGGWLDPAFCTPKESQDVVDDAWQRVRMVAEHFAVGTVVGRRLDQVFGRS